jgi:hypothetical protein
MQGALAKFLARAGEGASELGGKALGRGTELAQKSRERLANLSPEDKERLMMALLVGGGGAGGYGIGSAIGEAYNERGRD